MSQTKPEFLKVDDNFYWQTPNGEIVVPLGFKTGLYRRIVAAGDAVLQFALVLTELDVKKGLEALDDLELADGAKVSERYFQALAEHMGASLGE